jgi:hypothetical protein
VKGREGRGKEDGKKVRGRRVKGGERASLCKLLSCTDDKKGKLVFCSFFNTFLFDKLV